MKIITSMDLTISRKDLLDFQTFLGTPEGELYSYMRPDIDRMVEFGKLLVPDWREPNTAKQPIFIKDSIFEEFVKNELVASNDMSEYAWRQWPLSFIDWKAAVDYLQRHYYISYWFKGSQYWINVLNVASYEALM